MTDKKENRKLLDSVQKGNIKGVKSALESGGDPNAKDSYWTSALMHAVDYGYLSSITEHGSFGERAERFALKCTKLLIEKGADINPRNKDGWSALMYAVRNGRKKILNLLIRHGADVNTRDREGRSALIAAIERENIDIAETLVNKKADLNAKGPENTTALMAACLRSYSGGYDDLIKLLLKKGADANAVDKNGENALMIAIGRSENEIIKLLIDNTDLSGKIGEHIFVRAAGSKNKGLLGLLIRRGANIDSADVNKYTALIHASISGDIEMARFLLDNGADPNLRGNDGWSALRYAKQRGHQEIIELLEEHGARE